MKNATRQLTSLLIAALLLCSLCACSKPNKDPVDAEARLREAGYIVVKSDTAMPAHFKALECELTCMLTATKATTDKEGNAVTELVVIYYFADEENAKKGMAKVKEHAAQDKDEIGDDMWIAPKRSGEMVYYGTKAAFKATK